MEAPEGVAGDLVFYALGFSGVAFDGYARARRGENVEAVGGADLMDAEEMGAIADDDDAMKTIGAGDYGETAHGLVGAGAFGFSDGVGLGNAGADEVLLADCTFRELVAAVAAEGDDERGDAAAVERLSVIEPCAEDGRGVSSIFGGAEDCDGVGGGGLILRGIVLDLYVDPATPDQGWRAAEGRELRVSVEESAVSVLLFPTMASGPSSFRLLPLQHHDDFVGRNGALAEDFPASFAERQVDDGGGLCAASGSAVNDEGYAVAYLVADAGGVGTL